MANYDNNFTKRCGLLAPKLIQALAARNFDAHYCETEAEALEIALRLIPETATVAWGGSVTLEKIGLIDAVKKQGFAVIDRDAATSREEKIELMQQSLLCDVYLTSVNAMSEDGQLINVDGVGNRVAAMSFGPKSVVAVVGMNKVCKTVEEAVIRARTYAAPMNAMRLLLENTPCAVTGACADCTSDNCICSYLVQTRMCKPAGRIKIILVGQQLGF